MRLFTCINFNEDIKDYLTGGIEWLKKESLKGNFTRRENLHLTLVFIGETNKIAEVKLAMDQVQAAPFELTIGGIGRFKRGGGDIYWVGVTPNPSLMDIYHKLHGELVQRGFFIENRAYKPHLTLGREVVLEKDFGLTNKEEIDKKIFPPMTMQVDYLSLMKSERIRGQLTYTEIYRKEL